MAKKKIKPCDYERIPTEQDWEGFKYGLDEKYAYQNFCGKSQEEAYEMFKDNCIYYQEDLGYMPEKAFRFYLKPYMDYLLSPDAKGESDGASCFLSLIELTLEFSPHYFDGLWERVELVMAVLGNYQLLIFDANIDIYGDFKKRIIKIKKLKDKVK